MFVTPVGRRRLKYVRMTPEEALSRLFDINERAGRDWLWDLLVEFVEAWSYLELPSFDYFSQESQRMSTGSLYGMVWYAGWDSLFGSGIRRSLSVYVERRRITCASRSGYSTATENWALDTENLTSDLRAFFQKWEDSFLEEEVEWWNANLGTLDRRLWSQSGRDTW